MVKSKELKVAIEVARRAGDFLQSNRGVDFVASNGKIHEELLEYLG